MNQNDLIKTVWDLFIYLFISKFSFNFSFSALCK